MSNGRLNVGYVVNWGIYARAYRPQQLPARSLSHILYAFANVTPEGTVTLSDAWADKDVRRHSCPPDRL